MNDALFTFATRQPPLATAGDEGRFAVAMAATVDRPQRSCDGLRSRSGQHHEPPQQDWARMRKRWNGPALVIDAPAKLNLHLSVLGRRPDGYHDLETVMVSIGLYDTLVFEAADREVTLTAGGLHEKLATDDSNLVVRAARRLAAVTGCNRGARIHLTKRIPMQAGLGGGSSDAAATLQGLNLLWDLGLPSSRLHELAAELGSDLNFFLDSAPLAICRGRGELVEPRSLRLPMWFVVAKPTAGLSTAAVFRQLDLSRCGRVSSNSLLEGCEQGNAGNVALRLLNDLETPSRELSPELSTLLGRFAALPLSGSRMTGSGSACFGVALNREQANRAARGLRQQGYHEVSVVRTAV